MIKQKPAPAKKTIDPYRRKVWTPATVTVSLEPEGTKRVPCQRLMDVAVHVGIGDERKGWAVTSTTTGHRLSLLPTEPSAKAMAELLNSLFPEILEISDPGQMKAHFPAWVANWCLAQQGSNKVLDSVEYRRKRK